MRQDNEHNPVESVSALMESDKAVTLPVTVDVAEEIRRLEQDGRRLSPDDVVRAASDPASPLHRYFTWDDTAAAHQWRMCQAETLIRRCRVEVVVEDVSIRVPAYVRDTTQDRDERGYRALPAVRKTPQQSRSLMLYELRQAAGHLRRCSDIAVVLRFSHPIDELVTRIEAILHTMDEG